MAEHADTDSDFGLGNGGNNFRGANITLNFNCMQISDVYDSYRFAGKINEIFGNMKKQVRVSNRGVYG